MFRARTSTRRRGGGAAPPPARGFEVRSGDDRFIIYTGGTTGMPRGVVWGHENLLFAALQGGNPGGDPVSTPEQIAATALAAGEGMRIHPAAPLIHGAAQFSFWIGILTGGCCGLVPGRSFAPEATCELLDRHRINVFLVVGDAMARPMVDTILAHPGRWAFEELGVINSSGAILSGKIRVRLQSVFPDSMILNNFGSSESGHQGGAFYDDDGEDAKPQWIMDDTVVVLDDDFNVVEPGSGVVGRLARGGRLPECYYKDPEKTARTFVTVGDTRYVIPGDMATVDEDGVVQIFGRGAVCINTGGEKVFPEEVEEGLKAHPSVFDVLVVGVPDERWGERVEAVVAIREGHAFDAESLDAHARTKVAGYKAPRRYHQADAVARQPSGKPDYKWAKGVATAADS